MLHVDNWFPTFPQVDRIRLHSAYMALEARCRGTTSPQSESLASAAHPGKQQSICWDGKTPGPGAGHGEWRKVLHLREPPARPTVRLTIGDIRTYKIGDAQNEATRLKRLTDQGTDPRQQKIEERAKADAERTEAKLKTALVSDAWTAYLAHHKKRWGPRHFADHVNLCRLEASRRSVARV